MTVGRLIGMLVLQLVLIGINAFFAATELAVMQLNANKLRRQIEEGDKAAPRILKLVEAPSGFLSTIQIAITLAGFLASAFAADNFVGPLVDWVYNTLGFTALSFGTLNTVGIIVVTMLLSYFTLVLGELVPKQIAIHRPYQVAKFTSGVIFVLSVLMRPVVKLLSVSSRVVLGLFGIKGERSEEAVTEDEIRMMVDVGHESGAIDSEEKAMINNVFELDKTIARDVMTHRVDVVSIEADADDDEIVQIILESGRTRFPVYDDSLDDILGVLSSRTYLLNLRAKSPKTVRELLRKPRFVPETVPIDVLLRDMQQYNEHLAMVLDEYGGFSGIVTLEDIIEEIVGNIYDEFDQPEDPDIQQLEQNLWRIAGDTEIERIEQELKIRLPEEREYDSLGGLVFSCLSTIPNDGERVRVEVEGLKIETEPVVDHHVEYALVSVLPHESLDGDKTDDKNSAEQVE